MLNECFARGLIFLGSEEAVIPGWEALVAFVEEATVVAKCLI